MKPIKTYIALLAVIFAAACAGGRTTATQPTTSPVLRGTGDLGVVIERATGSVLIVETTRRTTLARVEGLGDLSHASLNFSRDARYAYVYGRDGGLTKIDLLEARIVKRIIQGGNSIGGAISQDGRLIAVSNYEPGGVRVFDADSLEMLADIPAVSADGKASKTVGLVDLPGNRFAYSLYDAGEIWVADLSDPRNPVVQKFADAGKLPYDALITPDGRFYVAGLFGEDGMSMVDLWHDQPRVTRVLHKYGKGEQKLPVYKMPHLEGWALTGRYSFVPGVGRHEVVVVDNETWQEVRRIPVKGQPVFVSARPDGRQVWVNFAFPDYDTVQVLDVPSMKIVKELHPGKAVLHMEFTPRGDEVWISARDANKVVVYRTDDFRKVTELEAEKPSGIFFTPRAHRIGM